MCTYYWVWYVKGSYCVPQILEEIDIRGRMMLADDPNFKDKTLTKLNEVAETQKESIGSHISTTRISIVRYIDFKWECGTDVGNQHIVKLYRQIIENADVDSISQHYELNTERLYILPAFRNGYWSK